MQLKFKGKVELGDGCRVSDSMNGAVFIDNQDVVEIIGENFDKGTKLTVGIADETFDGNLFIEEGWGYSEWTPMESDSLQVGGHDLISILERYEGEEVTMWVSDEPINILEEEVNEKLLEVKLNEIFKKEK